MIDELSAQDADRLHPVVAMASPKFTKSTGRSQLNIGIFRRDTTKMINTWKNLDRRRVGMSRHNRSQSQDSAMHIVMILLMAENITDPLLKMANVSFLI